MKRLVRATFILSLLFSANARADVGHTVGNGGGVICIDGTCRTLVEAGLRLSPEFNGVYIPPTEIYTAVQKYIDVSSILPKAINDDLVWQILGDMDVFRRVDVLDPSKLVEITDRYLKLAEEAGFPIDPNTFKLVAFSSDDTVKPALTYLLPDFFKLNLEQQASILLHEGLYRGRPSNQLKSVLQYENALFEIQKDKLGCRKHSVSCNDQLILAYKFQFVDKSQLIGMMLSNAMSQLASMNSEVVLPGTVDVSGTPNFVVDRKAMLKLAKYDSRIPYIFSDVERIPLKEKGDAIDDMDVNVYLDVKWKERGETSFLSQPKWLGGASFRYKRYVMVEPEQIPLLLPQ